MIQATLPLYRPYYVRAMWDWHKSGHNMLSFTVGELLDIHLEFCDGWAAGTNRKGEFGLFPRNYVSPLLERRAFEEEP